MSDLLAAFLLYAVGQFARLAPAAEAFARTGWPVELSVAIGAMLLACTVLYLIPRTSVLGAILLPRYLGGAVATNLRLENPLFTNMLFPVYFGVLAWVGLRLRGQRLGTALPILK